jgi:hypothetical protein
LVAFAPLFFVSFLSSPPPSLPPPPPPPPPPPHGRRYVRLPGSRAFGGTKLGFFMSNHV